MCFAREEKDYHEISCSPKKSAIEYENDADTNGIINSNHQRKFASALNLFIVNQLKMTSDNIGKVTVDVGDKMSDGSWDYFHIHFTSLCVLSVQNLLN